MLLKNSALEMIRRVCESRQVFERILEYACFLLRLHRHSECKIISSLAMNVMQMLGNVVNLA